jgi:peptidoglycan/LPS O-acetylase OafA/YrhL
VATINEANTGNSNQKTFLSAFSLRRNLSEITSTEVNAREIPILNGIRFVNMFMILLGHKTYLLLLYPIANFSHMAEFYKTSFSVPLRAIYLYTEVFLMLSGLLTAYSLTRKLNRGEKISPWKEVAIRYFRFMPPIIALILISTYVIPTFGDGPMWEALMTSQADLCKKYSWRNLLMIQNWFGFENICMFNLHHVGTDFIMFICGTFLIIYFHKLRRFNTLVFVTLGTLSMMARFNATYKNELSIYVRYGTR